MRQIKFRGKCERGYDYSDGDGWVYGSLLQKDNVCAIVKTEDIDLSPKTDDGYSFVEDFGCVPVIPETVGQYWRTVNDGDLYDGDIFTIEGKYLKIVRYKEDKAFFCVANLSQLECEDVFDIWQIPDEKWWNERNILIEVMGNEFDNPELLK